MVHEISNENSAQFQFVRLKTDQALPVYIFVGLTGYFWLVGYWVQRHVKQQRQEQKQQQQQQWHSSSSSNKSIVTLTVIIIN